MIAPDQQFYRTRSFRLWSSRGVWFWLFADGGAVGVTASRTSAADEARSAIDYFLRRNCTVKAPAWCELAVTVPTPVFDSVAARDGHREGWERALDCLADYLGGA